MGKITHKKRKDEFKDVEGIHAVSHAFQKQFHKWKKIKVEKALKKYFKRKYRTVRDGWKWQGYKLMQKIEEFAKKYPKDIEIVSIDDSYFCGSRLVLIHHFYKKGPNKGKNWGTTVVVVTQCDGQPPFEFFMYPHHQDKLLKSLQKLSVKNER